MGSEILVIAIIFGVIFGIFYLFISARNKERLALIEKNAEASIFYSSKKRITPVWKVLVLNLALLLMAIGVGIFIASILHYNLGVEEEVAYPGTIFLMAGVGLFAGFTMTKKLD
jgi:flagellar biosynthesis protein FliQ